MAACPRYMANAYWLSDLLAIPVDVNLRSGCLEGLGLETKEVHLQLMDRQRETD